jgi:hypothetical protein
MFNPYAMSADTLEEFMHDIAGTSLTMGQAEKRKKACWRGCVAACNQTRLPTTKKTPQPKPWRFSL